MTKQELHRLVGVLIRCADTLAAHADYGRAKVSRLAGGPLTEEHVREVAARYDAKAAQLRACIAVLSDSNTADVLLRELDASAT